MTATDISPASAILRANMALYGEITEYHQQVGAHRAMCERVDELEAAPTVDTRWRNEWVRLHRQIASNNDRTRTLLVSLAGAHATLAAIYGIEAVREHAPRLHEIVEGVSE
jgi:hypothetical protein